ncbi:fungal-specific transcription factor domain-containing protein [Schizophyllum amplum]|uniref:Fungal-specific transcription factor domain-containing protein n=1 Tax=Schizophyllum amplum TaxID=97359 RepID=A0A550CVT5_9AGAR|nr:fungal-specific transcription factor domain-containing protein [Auriculariopsis ampla]
MASQAQALSSNDQDMLRRKKASRACDYCRKRKARCDADPLSGRTCMNCSLNSVECTFDDTMKVRFPSALQSRMAELQNRVTELETQLKSQQESSHSTPASSHDHAGSSSSNAPSNLVAKAMSGDDRRQAPSPDDQVEFWEKTFPHSEEFDPDVDSVIQHMGNIGIGNDNTTRHLGRSSMGAYIDLLSIILIWRALHVRQAEDKHISDRFKLTRRLEYYLPQPWELEISAPARPNFTFPAPELILSLVKFYFDEVNAFFPIIHRPTFEAQLQSMAHVEDTGFACVLLVVCAIGARYSDDSRVLADESSKHSAGWSYFSQVEMLRKPMIIPPKLHDIQIHCLSVLFMHAASMVVGLHVWTRIGVTIRFAQDAGAHKRRTRKKITIEDELWNRCFWMLIAFDRITSAVLGRACAIQDEEFTIRYPMEVDDEYWDLPDASQAWKQPPGKPAVASTFVAWIKLTRIIEMTLRTIYTIDRTQLFAGVIEEGWERQAITELDSALNKWQQRLPQHLRYNPDEPNIDYLDRQVFLLAFYSEAQIFIHKPFITPLENSRPVGLPSLEICTSAARACAHALNVHMRRSKHLLPFNVSTIVSCGIVLILSLWTREKASDGPSVDRLKEYREINMCMDCLKRMEERWVTAGRFWDLLAGLNTAHQPLGKRRRNDADDAGSTDPPMYYGESDRSKAPLNFMDLLLPTDELLNSGTPSTATTIPTPEFQEWMDSVANTSTLGDPAAFPATGGMGSAMTEFAQPESWFKNFSTDRLAEMMGHPLDPTSGPMIDESQGMWADALPTTFECVVSSWTCCLCQLGSPSLMRLFSDWAASVPPTMPDFQADPLPPLFPYTQEPMGNSERPSWF